jgi:hypothetical protein
MNSPEIISAVLAEHRRDLQRQACASRLAAVARCCSARTWTAAARRIASRVTQAGRPAASCAC